MIYNSSKRPLARGCRASLIPVKLKEFGQRASHRFGQALGLC